MSAATVSKIAAPHQRRSGDVQLATGRGRTANLTETEARELTVAIRQTSARLWLMIAEAHDRKAWAALGYETWKDYVTKELQMSESRSYQILDTAAVMRELAKAGADVDEMQPPPARMVQKVKGSLSQVRRAARTALKEDRPVLEAVAEVARHVEPEPRVNGGPRRSTPAPMFSHAEPAPATPLAEGEKPPRGMRWCPACDGAGLLTIAQSKLVQEFVDQLAASGQ